MRYDSDGVYTHWLATTAIVSAALVAGILVATPVWYFLHLAWRLN